jgi:hypothetical protein
MTDRELMEMALEALDSDNPHIQVGAAISLRYRLAQPEREWVGLTDEERHQISLDNRPYCANIMRAHEEELKRRNGC